MSTQNIAVATDAVMFENEAMIPTIHRDYLMWLVGQIKPVLRKEDRLCYIDPVDPVNVSFLWDPKYATEAYGLVRVADIRTYHTYGYQGFFKPSIAEVLAAIPFDIVDHIVAFEMVNQPEHADDLNNELTALRAGYHVAIARLYRKE